MNKLIAVTLLFSILVLGTTVAAIPYADAISKRDAKAKDDIIKAIGKAVEGKYNNVKVLKMRKSGTSDYIVVYNTTKASPPVPLPPHNIAPTAKINASKLIANVSDIIHLSAAGSSDFDGNITSYVWTLASRSLNETGLNFTGIDAGSNATGFDTDRISGVEQDVRFPDSDKLSVTLYVTDNEGVTGSSSIDIERWQSEITPTPIPIPCGAGQIYNEETGQCVLNSCVDGYILNATDQCEPIPPPEPEPEPEPVNTTATTTRIAFVGDVRGTNVMKAIQQGAPDWVVVLGDLGYANDLKGFKSSYGQAFAGRLKCLIGNHDSVEDGSASIYKEARQYCGDHWSLKTANGTTLIIGFNSNANTKDEIVYVKSITENPEMMQGVKNVILTSHKNAHVNPKSHHPAEAEYVYNAVRETINTDDVRFIEINGHNHVLAAAFANDWYISGAGGRSHYECGTDKTWTFCDGTHYGFLGFDINDKTGNIDITFYDEKGNTIKKSD